MIIYGPAQPRLAAARPRPPAVRLRSAGGFGGGHAPQRGVRGAAPPRKPKVHDCHVHDKSNYGYISSGGWTFWKFVDLRIFWGYSSSAPSAEGANFLGIRALRARSAKLVTLSTHNAGSRLSAFIVIHGTVILVSWPRRWTLQTKWLYVATSHL